MKRILIFGLIALAAVGIVIAGLGIGRDRAGPDDVPPGPLDTLDIIVPDSRPDAGTGDTVAPADTAAPAPSDGTVGPAAPGSGAEPAAERSGADGRSPAPTTGDGPADEAGDGAAAADPPASTGSQEPDTDAILRAASRRYEAVRSLRAEFSQQLDNPLLGTQTRSRGTLYQRQPDRFLMRFSQPDGDLIVSDGDDFWLYFPSVDPGQVIRSRRGAPGLDLRSQFVGDPVRRFEATYEGREAVGGRPAHVLTLVPREPQGYRSLRVWIDAEDHLVRRFLLTEENGNVRRFELSGLEVNPTLPDGLFEFTPPAGAHVVERG